MVNVMIGLEIHVQLKTKSKLFCDCPTTYRTAEPNTNVCPTCTAQPGSKPYSLNKKALENLLKIAAALNCRIADESMVQRKHYFYPDLPSGYQRTSKPIGIDGKLGDVRIREAHIEEDPGRYELREGTVDYNRAGVPLVEIVTEPDMKSPEEARKFLDELAAILNYLDAGRDEPGSTRVDANVSIEGGTRVEVKNINSFKGVYTSLMYEIVRQQNILRRGQKVEMETRHFDEATGTTSPMRKKETEADYRYIPDPDVPPLRISAKLIQQTKKEMPELPRAKAKRFSDDYRIRGEDAWILVSEIGIANLFEKMSKEFDPQQVALWIRGPLKKQLNYRDLCLKDAGIKEEWLSSTLSMFLRGEVTDKGMEQILIAMIDKKKDPRVLKKELGLEKMEDLKEIGNIVDSVIAANQKAIADYKAGEEKALNFIVGQVVRMTKGKVDSKLAKELILKKI
jgi:aspartyl-tRNA(Asn)/glutamyl-tRNA(Gln) amidotransferase subunit B